MTLADPNNPNSTAGNAHMSGGSSIYEGQGSGKQDTFARDFMKQLGLMSLMSNPNTRPGFIKGMSALNFFKNPSRKTGIGALAPMLGFNPGTRDLVKYLPFLANPSMDTAKQFARNQGLGALFKKYGPKAAYSLFNQGGNFGLGEGGPMGQGIGPSLAKNPLQTIGKLKWAAANPAFAGIMALLNRASPRIEGQTGILGQGLGPQLRNFFSRFTPIKSYAEKNTVDESPIQEIEVTAQRREEQPEESVGEGYSPSAMSMRMSDDQLFSDLAASGLGSDKLSGLAPGAAMSTNQGLRATNIGRMLAKRAAARAITGKEAKYDRSGLNRFISSGGGRK